MPQPVIGLIGGTGLGEALGAEADDQEDIQTPFGPPSSSIGRANLGGTDVLILQRHGEGHLLNPSAVPYRANIYALKSLGVTHIIASGATGSLREEIAPRHLVIPDQVIDKTHKRPNTFYENAAVHVEFSQPFCPVLRRWLLDASESVDGLTVHNTGTYVCMEGSAFSTEAESHMHRAWGGDLIGMTVMPEARLAREAEIAYALVALPTDYDCWKPHPEGVDQTELLQEIIGNVKDATANSIRLITHALGDTAALADQPSPAHSALALGIWSNKQMIPAHEVERLGALWGKYFE